VLFGGFHLYALYIFQRTIIGGFFKPALKMALANGVFHGQVFNRDLFGDVGLYKLLRFFYRLILVVFCPLNMINGDWLLLSISKANILAAIIDISRPACFSIRYKSRFQ
jgi:hypothetical protein